LLEGGRKLLVDDEPDARERVMMELAEHGALPENAGSAEEARARLPLQVLQGLSRQQRKQLAEEVIRDALPGISGGELKALVRAGVYPKRYSPAQISATVYNQLRDAAGAAITFAGSAVSGVVREAANLTLGYARSLEIP
jgi:CheY-like chemotaxis protein